MNVITNGYDSISKMKQPVIISILSEIDDKTIQHVHDSLQEARRIKQNLVPMVINSPGGGVYEALHIAELLLAAKDLTIVTVGQGLIASAAVLLFSCGSLRILNPSARIMIHDVLTDIDATITGKALMIEADAMNRLKDTMMHMIAKNVGQSPDCFLDMLQKNGNIDLYVSAQEALLLRVATKIGYPTLMVDCNVQFSVRIDEMN